MDARNLSQNPFRTHNLLTSINQHSPEIAEAHTLAEAIVEATPEPLLVLDEELRVVTTNRSFRLMFRVEQKKIQGQSFYGLGNGFWNISELKDLLASAQPMKSLEIKGDVPGAGQRTMVLNARKLFYRRNDHALVLLTIKDITEQHAGEHQSVELLHQKETLLQEMQHRIANSLQIVASILILKARVAQSQEVRQHLNATHQQIMAVAAVQQQVGFTRHGEPIELASYLSRLCETLAAALVGGSRPISIRVKVDDAIASASAAIGVGLIVIELVINALKHAFVGDTTAGLIVVSYEVAEANWRLTVSDNGTGQSKLYGETAGAGRGTHIVEALARQLDGRVKISTGSSGTSVSITHGTLSSRLPRAAGQQHS